MVGLVDQHHTRRRELAKEGLQILPACETACRIVRIANIDQPRVRVDAREHGIQVVGVIPAHPDAHNLRAGAPGPRANRLERRHGSDELFSRTHQHVDGRAQDFAGATAENDLLRREPVKRGNLPLQHLGLDVRYRPAAAGGASRIAANTAADGPYGFSFLFSRIGPPDRFVSNLPPTVTAFESAARRRSATDRRDARQVVRAAFCGKSPSDY